MLLGQSRGKEVRVMMHHSRNSEQKQWDETVVIALSGMARLLRAHLPAIVGMDRVAGKHTLLMLAVLCGKAAKKLALSKATLQAVVCSQSAVVGCCDTCRAASVPACKLHGTPRLWSRGGAPTYVCLLASCCSAAGWEEMMVVVESSMAGGRKEVALAAIVLLSAVLHAHGSITNIVTPAMWKRAVKALGVGMEAATSPACMVPLPVSLGACAATHCVASLLLGGERAEQPICALA
jgi:hypothetical protein